jgi:hypothetical protein
MNLFIFILKFLVYFVTICIKIYFTLKKIALKPKYELSLNKSIRKISIVIF